MASAKYCAVTNEYPHIEEGAKVYINPFYVGENEKPWKFFVSDLSKGYCLLADTKKELSEGRGYIYSIWDITKYQLV